MTIESTVIGIVLQYEVNAEYDLRIFRVETNNGNNYDGGDQLGIGVRAPASIYVIASGPECGVWPGYTEIENGEVVFNCTMRKALSLRISTWIMNGVVVSNAAVSLVHFWRENVEKGAALDCQLQHSYSTTTDVIMQRDIRIDVPESPKIDLGYSVFFANEGDSVEMLCLVSGMPTPTIMWFDHNNGLIPGDEAKREITVKVITGDKYVTSILRVTVADDSYFGRYTCIASNNIKPDDQRTRLIRRRIKIDGDRSGTMLFAGLIAVIVFILLWGIKLVAKDQCSNTGGAKARPDTKDCAEIPDNKSIHKQEPSGDLPVGIGLRSFAGAFIEKFYKSPQKVAIDGCNIKSSRMTKASPKTGISHDEVDLTSIGGHGQQSQLQPTDTEQMQYSSLYM
ncbi:uncharacterized protein [Ptychodera flava]|uniref:uncharacterized protein n=1 Tax=Ptychodera flava TaxID=63121 RepID=UPI00396A7D78